MNNFYDRLKLIKEYRKWVRIQRKYNEKMKDIFFNLYSNKAIWCKTEKLANEFLELADRFGCRWCNGDSLINKNMFYDKKEDTCYYLYFEKNEVSYNSKDFFKMKNEKIMEFKPSKIEILKESSKLTETEKKILENVQNAIIKILSD